jgi:hypothetical protein
MLDFDACSDGSTRLLGDGRCVLDSIFDYQISEVCSDTLICTWLYENDLPYISRKHSSASRLVARSAKSACPKKLPEPLTMNSLAMRVIQQQQQQSLQHTSLCWPQGERRLHCLLGRSNLS